ncbi:hypothetical protein K469DRAFT_715872 [Zopfia rhizophila CBS 207.26]|uniref:Mitochondrial ribosomal protein-like protein n=1 Tax=Zopfia rhizophila CBS 207.26 TaxID=1314779 RepID=A0A6A6DKY3_9PEZI|nr:hypothetical protein K469DRAFT_715872 [Zopfia rhizophila CBS 207.26]
MATVLASKRALSRSAPLLTGRGSTRTANASTQARQVFQRGEPMSFALRNIDRPEKLIPVTKPYRSKDHTKNIIVYPPPKSTLKHCPHPIEKVTESQISLLDPTGARTRLFSKSNPECARVGDILLVRLRTGDPFAGVCINIRRRGVDTAILLRGQLTRVGVEMWYKVYSPLVEGIEVVERARKRARRARLTYMRLPKHDRGSVENVVRGYLRQKMALGSGKPGGERKGGVGMKKGGKKGKKR